jgi:hypothetical protein
MTSDLDISPFTQPVPASQILSYKDIKDGTVGHYRVTGGTKITGYIAGYDRNYLKAIAASANPDDTFEGSPLKLSATYEGKTVYYGLAMALFQCEDLIPDAGKGTAIQESGLDSKVAWSMIFGEKTGTSGGYQVPVQWPRTGDGLVLQTSFAISVVDISGT